LTPCFVEPNGFFGDDYVHNMPIVAFDPFGLWKVVPGSDGRIFESDGDGDSLQSLAQEVSGLWNKPTRLLPMN